ncbi:MAG: hypothetical protein O7F69_12770 [Alphaproteobacteria bacterium]|nr:hypothetical protein [Alphaproteobacteria bacterium]
MTARDHHGTPYKSFCQLWLRVFVYSRSGQQNSRLVAPRMAVIHPASIQSNHSSTHPSTPERFIALESAVEEIRTKLAAGLPLVPEVAVDTDDGGADSRPSTFRQE